MFAPDPIGSRPVKGNLPTGSALQSKLKTLQAQLAQVMARMHSSTDPIERDRLTRQSKNLQMHIDQVMSKLKTAASNANSRPN